MTELNGELDMLTVLSPNFNSLQVPQQHNLFHLKAFEDLFDNAVPLGSHRPGPSATPAESTLT